MNILTIDEFRDRLAARGLTRSDRRIRNDCQHGKIDGAILRGRVWWIPADSLDGYEQYVRSINRGRPPGLPE